MTVIFSDGFESGDFSAWTNTVGSPAIVETPVHHGSYAMSCDAAGDRVQKSIDATNTCYWRMYVYFSSLPTSGKEAIIGFLYKNGVGIMQTLAILNDGGTYKWKLHTEVSAGDYDVISTSPVPTTGVWYSVECKYVRNSANSPELWIDGVSRGTLSGTPVDQAIDYVMVGTYTNQDPITVIYDCVVVADAYIGPETSGMQLYCLHNAMGY